MLVEKLNAKMLKQTPLSHIDTESDFDVFASSSGMLNHSEVEELYQILRYNQLMPEEGADKESRKELSTADFLRKLVVVAPGHYKKEFQQMDESELEEKISEAFSQRLKEEPGLKRDRFEIEFLLDPTLADQEIRNKLSAVNTRTYILGRREVQEDVKREFLEDTTRKFVEVYPKYREELRGELKKFLGNENSSIYKYRDIFQELLN